VKEALQSIVEAELASLGFELVEMRRGGSKRRPLLDVRIDRPDGAPVTVDDCAKASRAIEAKLDESNLVGDQYVLEVGSPGVERVLRSANDWRRFVGKHASVLTAGARAEFEVVGVDGEPGAEIVALREKRGEIRRVPLAEIEEARLVFRW